MDAMPYIMKAVTQQVQETIQAETAGLALTIGYEAGLKERTLEFFVNFIAQRFPQERSERYILEWATRLLSGTAWGCADNETRSIMLQIAKDMQLENIPEEWSKNKKEMSEIYFVRETSHEILIKKDGQEIGRIFSKNSYSGQDSIQICGFDRTDGSWNCANFFGKKDMCLIF